MRIVYEVEIWDPDTSADECGHHHRTPAAAERCARQMLEDYPEGWALIWATAPRLLATWPVGVIADDPLPNLARELEPLLLRMRGD